MDDTLRRLHTAAARAAKAALRDPFDVAAQAEHAAAREAYRVELAAHRLHDTLDDVELSDASRRRLVEAVRKFTA